MCALTHSLVDGCPLSLEENVFIYREQSLVFMIYVQPHTPIAHVEQMLKRVRAYRG